VGAALKQPHAQLTFEPLYLLAQRGLHDMLPRSRAAEVQFLGQGHEVAKLAQLHAGHPYRRQSATIRSGGVRRIHVAWPRKLSTKPTSASRLPECSGQLHRVIGGRDGLCSGCLFPVPSRSA
jgi:hypothetical protein